MKKFSIISLFLLLSAAAFGQVAVQQAPGTYTDNSIVRRDGTYNKVQNSGVIVDDSDGLFVPGVISAGSGPTTLTDTSGKILSAALNIVAAAQGGFGANISASSGVPLFATGTATFTGTSGTGNFARVTSPTFVTPSLGVATGTSFNGVALTTGGSASTYLDATGAYSTPAGGGDMTLAGIQTVTGAKTFNSGKLILAGSTSGTSILNAAAIAGATTITLPNANSTLPIFGQQITFAGPTAARTVTFPDASFTVARTDAANTFTGVQTMTSPATTTSITTASTSFTAWAGATTLLTFGGTGASASTFFPSTLDTSSSVTGAIRTSGGISAAKALNIGTTGTFGGAITDTAAVPQIVLGVNTTTKGGIKMFGNTSGDVTISPLAVAGTATALTFPATSGGLIASVTAIGTVTGTPSSSNFLRGDGTWATPSGSGTVTVVSAGSLTSTALVTGGGTTTLQTPSATATMDSSGNISTPGTITTGAGGGVSGGAFSSQGTAPTVPANSIGYYAPTSVPTGYGIVFPSAPTTGFPFRTGTSSPQAETIVAANGTGNVLLSAGTAAIASAKTLTVSNSLTFAGTDGTTMTFPSTTATIARTDAANTFTGVQTMTSPAFTTSITTPSATFTALAGATTLLTLGGTGASASTFFPSTLDTSSSVTGAIRTSGGISAAKALNIGTTITGGGNLTIGTSNSATVGTIELGAASDTTLARSAAGVMSVEGNIVSMVGPRITAITSSATPTFDIRTCDVVNITALATAITSMTSSMTITGVQDFQQLEFRILDNGTARAITWGANFASGMATLPTTTVLGKALCVYTEYDAVQAKFMCQSVGSYP